MKHLCLPIEIFKRVKLTKEKLSSTKIRLTICKLHKVFAEKVIGESQELCKVVRSFYEPHKLRSNVGKFYELLKFVGKFYELRTVIRNFYEFRKVLFHF